MSGGSVNAIALPSGSGTFTCRTPFEASRAVHGRLGGGRIATRSGRALGVSEPSVSRMVRVLALMNGWRAPPPGPTDAAPIGTNAATRPADDLFLLLGKGIGSTTKWARGQRSEMGFRDRFNDLAKQAKDAVTEHQDQIREAVENVSVAADDKTHGKYSAKIAKVGEKASAAVDKLGPGGGQPAPNKQTSVDDSGMSEGEHPSSPPAEFARADAANTAGFPSFDDGSTADPPVFGSDTGASDDEPDPEIPAGF